jgi:hypothetical protein
MKRVARSFLFFTGVASALFFLNTMPLNAQEGKPQNTSIPDSLNMLFHKSCISCHGSKGELMSKSLLNFDKWQNYSDSKKIDKAAMICKMLTKGEMPPKAVRDSKPELVPTKEQVDAICKWASVLKAPGTAE